MRRSKVSRIRSEMSDTGRADQGREGEEKGETELTTVGWKLIDLALRRC